MAVPRTTTSVYRLPSSGSDDEQGVDAKREEFISRLVGSVCAFTGLNKVLCRSPMPLRDVLNAFK